MTEMCGCEPRADVIVKRILFTTKYSPKAITDPARRDGTKEVLSTSHPAVSPSPGRALAKKPDVFCENTHTPKLAWESPAFGFKR